MSVAVVGNPGGVGGESHVAGTEFLVGLDMPVGEKNVDAVVVDGRRQLAGLKSVSTSLLFRSAFTGSDG